MAAAGEDRAPRSAEATPQERIDEIVRALSGRAEDWTRVGLRERAGLLAACIGGVLRVAEEWVDRSCRAQGVDPRSRQAGELWLSGPVTTIRSLRLTAEALRAGGRPAPAALLRRGDQWIAEVVPSRLLERIVFPGLRAQVWLEPGAEPTQGRIYRDHACGAARPGVALVLGAGNVAAIAPRDVVHKLFVDDQVVVLKMHPVNEYLGPLFEQAFSSLIDAGYLAVVYGAAETGKHLCRHPLIDSIHLTGSHLTHDAIAWGGDPEERARRKAAGEPCLSKRVTSELGCVSPVIVVPGRWSDRELDYQSRSVAGMVTYNASFNCNAAKLVITSRGWPQREAFLQRLECALAATPPRPAYYPGAADRHAAFVARYPGAALLGAPAAERELPWALVRGVPADPGEPALGREAFCAVVAETAVEAADAAPFLAGAVALCNEGVWGSLSAMMLVDPRTERALGGRVDDAVAALRYGGVAINAWSGLLFGLAGTSWGAFPGNPLSDVGSGIGCVGNALLFDHPQKSVLRAPFVSWPKPVWFADHRTLRGLGRRLTRFEAAPSWRRLLPLLGLAARA